jgi:hypothetical protein
MTGISLKELARLSQDLNQASDALSKQIAQVEDAINELKLGVSAWVTIRSFTNSSSATVGGQPYAVTEVETIGYGKYKGKWGLLYSTYCEEFPEESNYEVPLRDAPRADRIAAVDKLPDLVRKLEKETKELADEANAKAAQVAAFAAEMRK